jgi:hypothetical protein
VVWYCLPLHGFVSFHFLCGEFIGESLVVVAWWSYIVLVSAYNGSLLLLHLFFLRETITLFSSASKSAKEDPMYLHMGTNHLLYYIHNILEVISTKD